MSKAFTKENDSEDDEPELSPKLPVEVKNYITPLGLARLKTELHELLSKTRPDLVQVVSWAAGNGDRSENGDYLYGKKRLREIDRRIRFLTQRLEIAEVIDPVTVKSKQIQFGASITYLNEEGQTKKISIVGIDESNPAQGKISWISPLAKSLLNHLANDVVSFKSPKGEEELEIVSVEYREIL